MQINMAPVVDIDLTVFRNGLTQSVRQPHARSTSSNQSLLK